MQTNSLFINRLTHAMIYPMKSLKLVVVILFFTFFTSGARAESKKKKLWRISAAVLGAVTVADMQSSYGRQEMNPLLQSGPQRFGGRGIAIKSAIVGATLGTQWFLLRKNPQAAGYAAGTNFAIATATGAVALRNHMLK